MRILVDGHNLIPYIPGLSLGQIDVEQKLIQQLQVYARQTRHEIEVFFDKAPPLQAKSQLFAPITAHFVSERTIADHAIRARLQALGAQAKQTVVISSDRHVQAEARARGARWQSSDQFAREILSSQPPPKVKTERAKPQAKKETVEPPLPPDEVQNWLDLFKSGKK